MKIAKRRVQLIAETEFLAGLDWDVPESEKPTPEMEWFWSRSRYNGGSRSIGGHDIVEFAGRACYQSFGRPNPATAMQRDYIRNIIEQRHFSVLEHAVATFYLTGVSRSFTHELIRHRHLSYSQLSQRFVDSSEPEYAIHPALQEILDNEGEETFVDERLEDVNEAVKRAYAEITGAMSSGATERKKKEIREAARAVLPNMTATKIVVTGNVRAWRHFILMRCTEHADREIREVAYAIFNRLSWYYRDFFQDMKVDESRGYPVVSSAYGEEDY